MRQCVSKKTYFKKNFAENSGNAKKTWQGIRSIINIKPSSKSVPTSLMIDNEVCTDPKKIANSFINYFSSVASTLQANIHPPSQDFSSYLKDINININKAIGAHSIPSNILHTIKQIISEPLEIIINMSFEQGKYIEALKISKATLVFKDKGSNLENCNYRPISLLSNINKIFEKIMYNRLYNFLTKYNCIYKSQFGFRQHHSTIHALIDLTENIRHALDKNEFAVGVFIDLQKAFDTVDHKILLNPIRHGLFLTENPMGGGGFRPPLRNACYTCARKMKFSSIIK